jgi:hypothetical protein
MAEVKIDGVVTEARTPKQRFQDAGKTVLTIVDALRIQDSLDEAGVEFLAPGVRQAVLEGLATDPTAMTFLATTYDYFNLHSRNIPNESRTASVEGLLQAVVSRLPVAEGA